VKLKSGVIVIETGRFLQMKQQTSQASPLSAKKNLGNMEDKKFWMYYHMWDNFWSQIVNKFTIVGVFQKFAYKDV
jgi:hypothetical protein